jgi:hypothetical protein
MQEFCYCLIAWFKCSSKLGTMLVPTFGPSFQAHPIPFQFLIITLKHTTHNNVIYQATMHSIFKNQHDFHQSTLGILHYNSKIIKTFYSFTNRHDVLKKKIFN